MRYFQSCSKKILIIWYLILVIYRRSFMMKYISSLCREVNVIFIPKGRGHLIQIVQFSASPISLISFVLNGTENALDQKWDTNPFHKKQHDYQKAKSTIAALHYLV